MKKIHIVTISIIALTAIAFISPKIYTAAASEGSFLSNIAKSVGLVKTADAEKDDDKKYRVCSKYQVRITNSAWSNDYISKNPRKVIFCTQRRTVTGEKEKRKYDKRYTDLVNTVRRNFGKR